jgi:uncharacterized protein (DUF1697 family)
MGDWAALSYSVVVTPSRRLTTADLLSIAAITALENPRTALATGNLLFGSPLGQAELETRLETVSEAQARDAIVAGRVFRPEIKGGLFPRSGSRDGLEPHLFYRESAMFVAYLAESNATAFEQLLEAIHARTDFAPAIRSVYHQDVGQLMTSFRREIVAERSR